MSAEHPMPVLDLPRDGQWRFAQAMGLTVVYDVLGVNPLLYVVEKEHIRPMSEPEYQSWCDALHTWGVPKRMIN